MVGAAGLNLRPSGPKQMRYQTALRPEAYLYRLNVLFYQLKDNYIYKITDIIASK